MEKLNEKDLIKMANKIYIEPTKDVLEYLKLEYEEINNNLEKLKKFDVSNIEPLARISRPITFLREDEIDNSIILEKKVALKNATEKNDDFIVIKRIIK